MARTFWNRWVYLVSSGKARKVLNCWPTQRRGSKPSPLIDWHLLSPLASRHIVNAYEPRIKFVRCLRRPPHFFDDHVADWVNRGKGQACSQARARAVEANRARRGRKESLHKRRGEDGHYDPEAAVKSWQKWQFTENNRLNAQRHRYLTFGSQGALWNTETSYWRVQIQSRKAERRSPPTLKLTVGKTRWKRVAIGIHASTRRQGERGQRNEVRPCHALKVQKWPRTHPWKVYLHVRTQKPEASDDGPLLAVKRPTNRTSRSCLSQSITSGRR